MIVNVEAAIAGPQAAAAPSQSASPKAQTATPLGQGATTIPHEEVLRATHDFLAAMLGTDRPSTSIAAGLLQKSGSMTYSRGVVRVVEHQRLEECACECYDILQQLSGSLALP
jgi:hypothetical protein